MAITKQKGKKKIYTGPEGSVTRTLEPGQNLMVKKTGRGYITNVGSPYDPNLQRKLETRKERAEDGRVTTYDPLLKDEERIPGVQPIEGFKSPFEDVKSTFEVPGSPQKEEFGLIPTAKEPGTGDIYGQFPTDMKELVKSFKTPEGRAQFFEAFENERAALFGTEQMKTLFTKEIVKIAGSAILATKITADIVGDVPVVGDIITGILGDNKEIVQNLQSSLEARNQMATSIASDVRNGIMNSNDALKALERLETEVNNTERQIQQEAILSPAVRRSGELLDIQTDILELRQEIYRSRNEILSVSTPGIVNRAYLLSRAEDLATDKTFK